MAGHSKWANIKHKKKNNDLKLILKELELTVIFIYTFIYLEWYCIVFMKEDDYNQWYHCHMRTTDMILS